MIVKLGSILNIAMDLSLASCSKSMSLSCTTEDSLSGFDVFCMLKLTMFTSFLSVIVGDEETRGDREVEN